MAIVMDQLSFSRVKNGEDGKPGPAGPPSGAIESSTIPENPYDGMLWKNTGDIVGYINAVYRWNGNRWDLWELSAQNIKAETFQGYTFAGSEFINDFDFLAGFDWSMRGTTTIKDARVVIDAESYQEGMTLFNQRFEFSPTVGGLYMEERSPKSSLPNQWILLTPHGLSMQDKLITSSSDWTMQLTAQDLISAPATRLTAASGYSIYAETGDSEPLGRRNGRGVMLSGAFKNNASVSSSASTLIMGYLPVWLRPAERITFISQGSGMNKFMLMLTPNGEIRWSRYGVDSMITVPAGAWLNISCTYTAGDL